MSAEITNENTNKNTRPKVIIMSGYGINCEKESAYAFDVAGADSEIVHINDLIAKEKNLDDYDIMFFPGGFSYGDDTGSGNAFANKVKNNLWPELKKFIDNGKLIIGVCNGFQIMSNLGLFATPNSEYGARINALLSNNQNRYEDRWVHLKHEGSRCVFTKDISLTHVPIAHGEGKFFCDEKTFLELKENKQIVFRYCNSEGGTAAGFPENPNGALYDVAGICDRSGRILGMMPHPERGFQASSEPHYHLKKESARREGKAIPEHIEPNLKIFENAIDFVKEKNLDKARTKIQDKGDNMPEEKQGSTNTPEQKSDSKEKKYKDIIRKNLHNTLDDGHFPELGEHYSGKVRHVHFTKKEVGAPIIMVASDRVSVFDHILNRKIPFKGMVLNLLNEKALAATTDIVKNASLPTFHPSVIVQKYCKNIMVECVVRGYVWGSMAAGYEKGDTEICGIKMPEGLLRYQKLEEPMFTPTTKSEHDEPMTYEEVEEKLGKDIAKKVKEKSIELFKRGEELAAKHGLLFIDTKYEFGLDENGEIVLIDEANTPDSSRYSMIEEYEKFDRIKEEMAAGKYKDVSELIKEKPELKIKEMSKQFVRDIITKKGFSYGSTGPVPELEDDDVVEISYRYIMLYEQMTGENFPFPYGDIKESLIEALEEKGYLKKDYNEKRHEEKNN